jgi:amino acid transporter
MKKTAKIASLSMFTTVMLISGAIDSIRNLPAAALFGSTLVFFFIFSALVFLLPTALVSAELSSTWSEKSGVYQWIKLAFGEKMGFLAIWLQWINTMVWYPTILSFIAGTASFLINPALAHNKFYLIGVILISIWTLTLLNLRGINTSARFASICTVFGMVLPMVFIILLAIVWLVLGKPLQISLSPAHMVPALHDNYSWMSLTAIMSSFLGIELATVHVNKINNPQMNFPRAIFYSSIIILTTMVLGSLAIAIVLPKNSIGLVDGVMEAYTNFFAVYHISWIMPIITLLLLIGSLGGLINWIISPAKGLLQAAQDGFLPAFLQKENKHGVEANLLITQAILVSLFCLAFLFMPSINASYWLLTALSTELYMLMYILLLLASLRLRYKYPNQAGAFLIPGKKLGLWLVSLLGIVGCSITLLVGFLPPVGINMNMGINYSTLFSLGIIVMLMPVGIFYGYKRYCSGKETPSF